QWGAVLGLQPAELSRQRRVAVCRAVQLLDLDRLVDGMRLGLVTGAEADRRAAPAAGRFAAVGAERVVAQLRLDAGAFERPDRCLDDGRVVLHAPGRSKVRRDDVRASPAREAVDGDRLLRLELWVALLDAVQRRLDLGQHALLSLAYQQAAVEGRVAALWDDRQAWIGVRHDVGDFQHRRAEQFVFRQLQRREPGDDRGHRL